MASFFSNEPEWRSPGGPRKASPAQFRLAAVFSRSFKTKHQGDRLTSYRIVLARPERLELPTFCFVGRRSIQLSYGRACVPSNYKGEKI